MRRVCVDEQDCRGKMRMKRDGKKSNTNTEYKKKREGDPIKEFAPKKVTGAWPDFPIKKIISFDGRCCFKTNDIHNFTCH